MMVGCIAEGLGVSVGNSGVGHSWVMVETPVGKMGVGWVGHA